APARPPPDAVPDRHALVPPMEVVEVDDVGAKPPESGLAGALQGLRPTIDHALAVDTRHTALAGEEYATPEGGEHFANELLVAAESVQGCRVDVLDAELERVQQQLASLVPGQRCPVRGVETHAAEADLRDVDASDAALFHGTNPGRRRL